MTDPNESIESLFDEHRPRLKRMVALRLDPRVRARVDDSDVLQDAYLEAARRLDDYLKDPPMPFFLWLRWITGERIKMCHRKHLGAERRDATRDRILGSMGLQASTQSLAMQLAGQSESPSRAAMEAELYRCVEKVMDGLPELDREVLVLRHFEQLTNQEAARVLGMNPSASSSRYVRALDKLRKALGEVPGFF
ncbi:MAG: sigma-70 family RNA polymerase sigma factor [Planctomycetota bacterium]